VLVWLLPPPAKGTTTTTAPFQLPSIYRTLTLSHSPSQALLFFSQSRYSYHHPDDKALIPTTTTATGSTTTVTNTSLSIVITQGRTLSTIPLASFHTSHNGLPHHNYYYHYHPSPPPSLTTIDGQPICIDRKAPPHPFTGSCSGGGAAAGSSIGGLGVMTKERTRRLKWVRSGDGGGGGEGAATRSAVWKAGKRSKGMVDSHQVRRRSPKLLCRGRGGGALLT